MKAANILELDHVHNPLLCEQCCRAIVVTKHRWLECLQEHLHAFGEILLMLGKSFAMLLLGGQFIVEAIFPHLNRQKHPYELEYERNQREWEAKRDSDAQSALKKRVMDDANEEAAYLNSLKLSFAHSKELYEDNFLAEQRNKLVDQMEAESKDPEKDRITLRKYAVDVEQLRLFEMRQNQRREQLQNEVDYHVSEMKYWHDRAYAAHDSKERTHCEREKEVHQYKAYYAKVARENI
ncbi:MAG: hypothetical protein HYX67_11325 [Candidatus Melainabacteria bacterium]|nr:hypothetical protein [Candidatus Melainabacteria bacterium]